MEMMTMQINLYDCNHAIMIDQIEMNDFLEKLVDTIGMKKIPEDLMERENPHSVDFEPDFLPMEEHGITGNIIMCESHIHAHSFPHKDGFLNIVITSCKFFDEYTTLLWITRHLNVSKFKHGIIKF